MPQRFRLRIHRFMRTLPTAGIMGAPGACRRVSVINASSKHILQLISGIPGVRRVTPFISASVLTYRPSVFHPAAIARQATIAVINLVTSEAAIGRVRWIRMNHFIGVESAIIVTLPESELSG